MPVYRIEVRAVHPQDDPSGSGVLSEIRQLGIGGVSEVRSALTDLEQYVRYRAGARDIQTVTETVRSLRRHAVEALDPEADADPDEDADHREERAER